MTRLRILLVTLLVLICGVLPGGAPELSGQILPADSAAVLLDAAARFEREGDPDVARAIYRYIVERFPASPAAQAARERLGAARAQGTAGSGRVELQVWSTLYGLWLGIAVPAALGVDDPEPYGLGLLVGGPAGFVAGRHLAGSRDLTEGQARAISLGGTWGTWQGYGWAEVLDLGSQEICTDPAEGFGHCYEGGDATEEKFTAMIVGGLAGIVVGNALSHRTVSPGVATTANFGALWGTWFGFAGGYLADLEDDALLATTLLGGDAGLLAAAALAPGWNVSRSRARLVSLYGVVGALSGLGLDLLIQPDDDKVAIGIPLATSIIGLALGVAATRGYDELGVAPAPTGPPGGALLQRADGRWALGTPLPVPRSLHVDVPGARGPRSALGVTLLSARFR